MFLSKVGINRLYEPFKTVRIRILFKQKIFDEVTGIGIKGV